ncbi:G-type lectin S-receptor-like serine/threonine-protein kinase At4g27290 [Salvia miltiorrhiza]|uniref:G-type lectin S-receptor-like serine/threonine-protein kinase At4g27290 n=1 Tax=Salvia miltiorrhiza TaxID=226208 RepID=UPI0025AC0F28|nr:G-type lectin S-receptor-like serine/threonine-protein kinase At4g27290 [Salvia miltiorrhiza]
MEECSKRVSPFVLICSLIIHTTIAANDTIKLSQSIRDGETVVSSGGMFELGFFSPQNSSNRYVGIWYKAIPVQTVVWVANREAPLTNKTGVLTVTEPGILSLLSDANGLIWSTNRSRSVQNPIARLLDSGNLVVKDADHDDYLWQSFDYPCDTFLPGMSLGWNYTSGVESYISSWRSESDPAPGRYTAHLDPTGYPQMLIKEGDAIKNRMGPWNGVRLSGAPDISNDPMYILSLVRTNDVVKYKEDTRDQSAISRSVVTIDGDSGRWIWNSQEQIWTVYRRTVTDPCDAYNSCGPNGYCDGNSPFCRCLDRFEPRDKQSWDREEWLGGCVRRADLNCSDDVFLNYSGIKLPDSTNSTIRDDNITLQECEAQCKRSCSCTAYTRLDIKEEGRGCLFYHGELVDIRILLTGGQDLYIRLASSEYAVFTGQVSDQNGKKRAIIIASLASVTGVILVCLSIFWIITRKRNKEAIVTQEAAGPSGADHVKEGELPFFSFSTILKATDHFPSKNKLGEGGFGPVYKGKLEDGQEIAVKRLAKTSSQGVDELKNEVMLIAKLQHRNLVRTLGFCAEGEENMLIYEYMPNHSLDLILFDQTKSMSLDWRKRFHIINGIAKGLLYLHQDSRLRIIHRDLKASNILLDADMNPKISDFGLARSFGGNETEAQTRRVVGTYGYMAPEYATDGLFSVKSDVFSFGVLMLEIVSGKKNRGFFVKDDNLNLLGHAWRHYRQGESIKLVDPALGEAFDAAQVVRSINVGLLCVQNCVEDRPNMSAVIFMLGNEVALPQAKQPGFFTEKDVFADRSFSSSNAANSQNQITITMPEGR